MLTLPKRVVSQPQPHLHQGGDCGACVLGGLLGWEPLRVYDELLDGKVQSISYYKMHEILRSAHGSGLFDRILVDSPVWLESWMGMHGAWGPHGSLQSIHWFQYVQLGIDAGHYAVANVDTTKSGPFGPGPNHWVLLCGVRSLTVPIEAVPGASRIDHQVLVSCSSSSTPDEEWVNVHDFLKERGGFNVMLVRPAMTP